MDAAARRCEACGNYVDAEDIFCSNCGRECPKAEGAALDVVEAGFVGFDCESCGASVTYDAAAEGLRCSFCGSVRMKRQAELTGRIRAEFRVPFAVRRDDAVRAFRGWISRGLFRPFGISRDASVVSMQAVYIPFWRFRGDTHTYYVGDSSVTPAGARADWCPLFGEQTATFADVLVCASGSLRSGEALGLAPFDLSRSVPYEREGVGNAPVEDFGLSRRGARSRAFGLVEEAERAACAARIPGRARNVHVNPLVTDIVSEPVLLPVWVNAYRFRGELYRFCVNGQTGKVVGSAPTSFVKVALVIGAVALAAVAAAALFTRS